MTDFTHPEPFDLEHDELRRAVRRLPDRCPDGWRLIVIMQRNGQRQVRGQCTTCGVLAPGFVRLDEVPNIDELTVLRDHRTSTPCERCGATTGVERHHWAPVYIFGWDEAEQWPTSMLCPPCHREWHRMVNGRGGS